MTKIKYSKLLKSLLYILIVLLLFLGGGRIFLLVKAIAVYDLPQTESYRESYLLDQILCEDLESISYYAIYGSMDENQIQEYTEKEIENERQRAQQLFLPIDWLQKNEPTLFWIDDYLEYVSREEYDKYLQGEEIIIDDDYENQESDTADSDLHTTELHTDFQGDYVSRFPDAKYNDYWKTYMQDAVDNFVSGTNQYFEGRTDELSPEFIDDYYNKKLNNIDIIQEDLRLQIQHTKDYAKMKTNLKFALVNRETDKIYSNFVSANSAAEHLPEQLNREGNLFFYCINDLEHSQSSSDFHARISASLMESDKVFDFYIYLPKTLAEGDLYYALEEDFNSLNENFQQNFNQAVIFLALAAAIGIYLIIIAGRRSDGSLALLPSDKLYNDLHLLLSGAAVAGLGFLCLYGALNGRDLLGNEIVNSTSFIYNLLKIGVSILFAFAGMILLEWLVSASRNIKNNRLLKHSLIYRLLRLPKKLLKKLVQAYENSKGKIADLFGRNMVNISKTSLLAAAAYVGVNVLMVFFTLLFARYSFFLFLVCFFLFAMVNLAVLFLLFKSIQGLDKIMSAARSIRSGNLNTGMDILALPLWLRAFAKDILDNQEGLRNAVSDAIKNERMKAELITNVSHDLKTPLTSIVSYVNLLKKRDIEDEEAQKYIDILDEKAERLKRLIEDLVEASKASTGNLALNPVKIDLYELAVQAVGENSDDLESNNIECRINEKTENIVVWADSQRTWRIIDNLFSNARKYTQGGTRIYIDITREEKFGVFTMKNISKDALNVPVEVLTQRFVRGDEARSGEGSGLGLSIAKNLCELQGGIFSIEIDGDLFKVIVRLPLSKI